MAILLTEKAATAIKDIMKQHEYPADATRLRVGVKGGGCSGLTYMLDLVEEAKGEQDEELECNGIQILVDMRSYLYLNGTEIDYKDGLMGTGFAFRNPNNTSTCGGCGSAH